MKTGEELKRQAEVRNITRWDHHDCGLCGYMTAYHFRDGEVYFDPGCYCANGGMSPRSWDDVAEFYNMQTHPETQARFAAFWGFDVPSTKPSEPTL